MDSSPRLRVYGALLTAILKETLFTAARLQETTSQRAVTRWLILQRHAVTEESLCSDLLRGARFQVLFHSPLRGCFSPFPHGTGSLSVMESIQPWRAVPPGSNRVSCPAGYSGCVRPGHRIRVQGPITAPTGLSMPFRFPDRCEPAPACETGRALPRPPMRGQRLRAHRLHGFRLSARSLAATSAISVDFRFPRGVLRCFSSPVAYPPMRSAGGAETPLSGGLPFERPAGQSVFAALRRLSRLCRVLRNLPCQGHPPCAPVISSLRFAFITPCGRGRQFEIKKVFRGIHINVHCDRDMRTTCDNPEDRLFKKSESEGFSLMILTSVNAMQLSKVPGWAEGRSPSGEGPGDRRLRKQGWGIQALRYRSPMRGEPMSTSGARELARPRVGPEGPDFSLERR